MHTRTVYLCISMDSARVLCVQHIDRYFTYCSLVSLYIMCTYSTRLRTRYAHIMYAETGLVSCISPHPRFHTNWSARLTFPPFVYYVQHKYNNIVSTNKIYSFLFVYTGKRIRIANNMPLMERLYCTRVHDLRPSQRFDSF